LKVQSETLHIVTVSAYRQNKHGAITLKCTLKKWWEDVYWIHLTQDRNNGKLLWYDSAIKCKVFLEIKDKLIKKHCITALKIVCIQR
jgi:hypothetical protein